MISALITLSFVASLSSLTIYRTQWKRKKDKRSLSRRSNDSPTSPRHVVKKANGGDPAATSTPKVSTSAISTSTNLPVVSSTSTNLPVVSSSTSTTLPVASTSPTVIPVASTSTAFTCQPTNHTSSTDPSSLTIDELNAITKRCQPRQLVYTKKEILVGWLENTLKVAVPTELNGKTAKKDKLAEVIMTKVAELLPTAPTAAPPLPTPLLEEGAQGEGEGTVVEQITWETRSITAPFKNGDFVLAATIMRNFEMAKAKLKASLEPTLKHELPLYVAAFNYQTVNGGGDKAALEHFIVMQNSEGVLLFGAHVSSKIIAERYSKLFGLSSKLPPTFDITTCYLAPPPGTATPLGFRYQPSPFMVKYNERTLSFKDTAQFADPTKKKGSQKKVDGIIYKTMLAWADSVIATVFPPVVCESSSPWPASAPPTASEMEMASEAFASNQYIWQMFHSKAYFELFWTTVTEPILKLTNSLHTTANSPTDLYIISQKPLVSPSTSSPISQLSLLSYIGITSSGSAHLRERVHKHNSLHPKSTTALLANPPLYDALHSSFTSGRALIRYKLMPSFPSLTSEAAHFAELALIRFLHHLPAQKTLNRQAGNSTMSGQLLPLLSDEKIEAIGCSLYLFFWHHTYSSLTSSWIDATSTARPHNWRLTPAFDAHMRKYSNN